MKGSGLRDAGLTAGRWGGIQVASGQVLATGTTVILARILVPQDFGQVAIALSYAVFFGLFAQLGLGAQLVQDPSKTVEDERTVFTISAGLGLVLSIVAALATPLLAKATDASVQKVALVLAWSPAMTLLRTVPEALLFRRLEFRALGKIQVLGQVCQSTVSIGLALAGLGAIGVACGYLTNTSVVTIATFSKARWGISAGISRRSLAKIAPYSSAYFSHRLLGYCVKNGDYWALALVSSSAVVGVYYIAYTVPSVVRLRLTNIVQRSLHPLISQIQSDSDRVTRAVVRTWRIIGVVVLPLFLFLSLFARDVLAVAFGPEWIQASGTLAILSVSAIVDALGAVLTAVPPAVGRPGINLRAILVRATFMFIGLAIYAFVDSRMEVVAITVLISGAIGLIVKWHWLNRIGVIRLRIGHVSSGVTTPTLAAVAVGASLSRFSLGVPVFDVALGAISIGGTFALVGYALHRELFRVVYSDARDMVFPRRLRSSAT